MIPHLTDVPAAVPAVPAVQGMMVTEQIMDQVAHAVGKPVEEIKRLNMYNVSEWCNWLICGWVGGWVGGWAGGRAVGWVDLLLVCACELVSPHPDADQAPSACPSAANHACVQEGDVAPFGQKLVGCQAQRCWEEVMTSSDFATRKQAVQQYNTGTRYR